MTREEEIIKVAELCASANTQIIGDWGEHFLGFIHGAEWADAHPNWISVEDELPKNFKIKEGSYYAGKFEETDIVMVAFDDGDFGFARYVHDFPDAEEGEAWYWFAEGNLSGVNLDDGDITHWMPLPQAPSSSEFPNNCEKGEEDEDHFIDANKKVDRVIGTADHIKTALDVLNKKGGEK